MKYKIPIIFVTMLVITSCTQPSHVEPEVTSLSASLNKTSYTVGETLDYENLSVRLTKSDQSTQDVTYANFASNNIDFKLYDASQKEVQYTSAFSKDGTYNLSIFLTNKDNIKDEITIKVSKAAPPITISSVSITYDKVDYFEFEKINLSTLSLTITYSDGSQKTITNSQLSEYGFGVKLLDSSSSEVNLASDLALGTYKLVVANDSGIKDEVEITVTEEDFGTIGQEDLESLSNSFKIENNKYIAEECRSIKIFDNSLNKGTYKVDISRGNNANDDYLIFGYNQNNKSYYSYGLNLANKLQITYFDGTKLILVKSFDIVVNTNATLAIAFNNVSGAVDYYLNNELVYANNILLQGDLKYGFYAGTKGCEFSNVMIDNDDTIYDSDPANYKTAHGTIDVGDNSFTLESAGALNYNTKKTFKYGEIEATYNAKNANNNVGIAFCIDNQGRETFYREEDITYYYLCVTINGSIGLYRVANKVATLLKSINTKWYYKENNHVIKAVRDNNNTIHAFLDGVYYFSYVDRHPLKGDKFGVHASSSTAVSYYHISAKTSLSAKDETITKYDVVSGSFYQNKDFIVSNAKNSMIINKTPGEYNGTIEAEIAMGRNYGTGLVFRLTRPESNTFYESEDGLSYYWLDVKSSNRIIFGKVVNGNISWTMEKYMPYFMSNAARVKIVLDGNNIYAYFTDVLTFHYVDNNPLTGLYYGLRSDSDGAALYGDMSFTSNTEHEQNRYLIFGHSYTQLWHHYKDDFAELGDDINDIGIGGSQTGNWSKQYNDEVVAYNPEWGIYWNGINDINAIEWAELSDDAANEKINTIITNFTNCLEYIKGKLPNFKCVVISVSRCTHEKSIKRIAQITKVNQGLKELCDANDWLIYVEAETIFCDDQGNPMDSYFVDKLHPTVEGYRLVAPLVVDAIKNYQA